MSKRMALVGFATVGGLLTGLLYLRWLRPWQLSWGASAEEVARPLPGDELIERPTFTATRGITIAAPPEQIWPWLLQVGVTRAGWYSYDLLDNLGRPSADRIISDFQQVDVGDVIPMSPDGKQGLLVHDLDLPRSMTWVTPGATSWVWVAEPQADGSTRLITRIRSRYRWLSPSIAFSALVEFGDIWMMRKMLRTLRERVEGGDLREAQSSSLDGSRASFVARSLLPRPLRAFARAAVFFLKVLPMLPSGALDLVTTRPVVDRVTYPTRLGSAVGDLYRPTGSKPVPGIVVCLGVVPFGVEHPQVARLGEALARSGLAALLYWSPEMRDRRLDPGDTAGLALAYEWLVDQTYIDESRSGLLGTCVGGAFALMAAAEPLIRERVSFVAAFAPYSSMWTFARDIASSSRELNGNVEHWEVDPLTRDVFVRSVTDQLLSGEREVVRALLQAEDAGGGVSSLSPDAAAVLRLLTVGSRDEANRALAALPARMRDHLSTLSPLIRADEIKAPLILIGHDRDDQVIPVTESRQLQRALTSRVGVHYTEFALFQHTTPRQMFPLGLTAELAKFYRYAYPIFQATS